MKVVVAPDSFGGTLSAREAAEAIAQGWGRARPDDEVVTVPLADGGEGLLDVLAAIGGTTREVEVAGPHGKPVLARWLLRDDGSAFVESAQACGLAQLPADAPRTPLRTTTYGVGQLLQAACDAGCERVVVGLGGSATVDGGAGALTALGLRLLRADGNGLKVGGGELAGLASVARGWLDPAWQRVAVELWSDVRTALADAARVYGPQKGATPDDVEVLDRGLRGLADALERDLGADPALREAPGSGAAGGLGYGLAAALGAPLLDGAAAVAGAVGLEGHLDGAELVVTGEGRLDATSLEGKVVGHVLGLAGRRDVPAAAVVGQVRGELDLRVEAAAPDGPGDDPAGEVAAAAGRLASAV